MMESRPVEYYLSQLGRNYELADYSYTSAGGSVYRQICPYNPNRVAFWCANPNNGDIYIKLDSGTYAPIPNVYNASGNYCWINTSQHLILPFQELFFYDNIIMGQTRPAYGIVRKGG